MADTQSQESEEQIRTQAVYVRDRTTALGGIVEHKTHIPLTMVWMNYCFFRLLNQLYLYQRYRFVQTMKWVPWRGVSV